VTNFKIIFWPNVFFHGQQTSEMATFSKIGHEMANLANLQQ